MAWLVFTRQDGNAPAPLYYSSADFEVYSTLEDLSAVSDLAIVGTVNGIAAHALDYGTSDPEEKEFHTGEPVVFYEVMVNETLKGDAPRVSIIVGATDVNQVYTRDASALIPGQNVVLFLRKRTHTPGITTYRDSGIYVPISMDNGVLDLEADGVVVTPRGRSPDMFGPETTFTLSGVRDRLRADSP